MMEDKIVIIPASAPEYMGGTGNTFADHLERQPVVMPAAPAAPVVNNGVQLQKYIVRVAYVAQYETSVSALVDVYCVRSADVLDTDGNWAVQPFTNKIKSNINLPYGHPCVGLLVKGIDLQVDSLGLSATPKAKRVYDKRSGVEQPVHPFLYIDEDSIVPIQINDLIYAGVDEAVGVYAPRETKMQSSAPKEPGLGQRLWNAVFPKRT